MLSGNNGILQRATEVKQDTERQSIVEQARIDILAKISEKKGESITESELEEILISSDYSTQGTLSNEENVLDRTLTSKDGKYEIPVSKIYNGNLKTENNKNTITFYIKRVDNNLTYEAKEGMTFRQWITEYSPEDFSEYINYVAYQIGRYRYLLIAPGFQYPSVKMDDQIEKDAEYGLFNIDD